MLAPTAETFREFLEQQDFFVFIVTIYVGAGLIANDRRANALQIYLSKPLMRTEYIAGKAAILFTFLMLVTWVPAILLLFLQVMFDGSFAFLKANLFLFPAITVGVAAAGAARDLHDAGAVVAVEEQPLRRHPLRRHHLLHRGDLRRDAARSPAARTLSWLSLGANLPQVVDVIFRLTPRYATPWQVSLIVILGLIALSISVLERRVRGVEVVT